MQLGGANGIGRAMVELLYKLGSTVVVCDLDDQAGQALNREMGSYVAPSCNIPCAGRVRMYIGVS